MKDMQTIVKHLDIDDSQELKDVLMLMAKEIDRQSERIATLEKKMKRVNEAMPSTAVR